MVSDHHLASSRWPCLILCPFSACLSWTHIIPPQNRSRSSLEFSLRSPINSLHSHLGLGLGFAVCGPQVLALAHHLEGGITGLTGLGLGQTMTNVPNQRGQLTPPNQLLDSNNIDDDNSNSNSTQHLLNLDHAPGLAPSPTLSHP